MSAFIKAQMELVAVLAWLSGIVVAKGFLSTLAAVFFPPWGWYLLVELAWTRAGMA